MKAFSFGPAPPIICLVSFDIPFTSRAIFRAELRHVCFWAIVWGSLNGPFCSYVAIQALDASDLIAALIGAAMAFANLLAPWWLRLAHRGQPRRVLSAALAATSLVLLSFALTPWCSRFAPDAFPPWFLKLTSPIEPVTAVVFAMQIVLGWIAIQAANSIRTTIWKTNYPAYARGRVLARFAVWQLIIGSLWVALIGVYFDGHLTVPDGRGGVLLHIDLSWLPRAGEHDAYGLFFPLAAVAGVASLLLFQKVKIRGRSEGDPLDPTGALLDGPAPEPSYALPGWLATRLDVLRAGIAQSYGILRHDSSFRRYMFWMFLSGSAVMMVQVPFVFILKDKFDVSYAKAAVVLTFLPQVALVAFTPLFGRLFDRWGLFHFRSVQMSLWVISRLVLTVAVWQVWMPLVFVAMTLMGVALAGGRLAWQLGHMHFSDRANDSVYLGIHQSLTGIRGLIMPFAGALLYRYVLDWHIIWISSVMLVFSVAGYARLHREQTLTA